jgi:hypothetical protein
MGKTFDMHIKSFMMIYIHAYMKGKLVLLTH